MQDTSTERSGDSFGTDDSSGFSSGISGTRRLAQQPLGHPHRGGAARRRSAAVIDRCARGRTKRQPCVITADHLGGEGHRAKVTRRIVHLGLGRPDEALCGPLQRNSDSRFGGTAAVVPACVRGRSSEGEVEGASVIDAAIAEGGALVVDIGTREVPAAAVGDTHRGRRPGGGAGNGEAVGGATGGRGEEAEEGAGSRKESHQRPRALQPTSGLTLSLQTSTLTP